MQAVKSFKIFHQFIPIFNCMQPSLLQRMLAMIEDELILLKGEKTNIIIIYWHHYQLLFTIIMHNKCA